MNQEKSLGDLHAEIKVTESQLRSDTLKPESTDRIMTHGNKGLFTRPQVEAAIAAATLPDSLPAPKQIDPAEKSAFNTDGIATLLATSVKYDPAGRKRLTDAVLNLQKSREPKLGPRVGMNRDDPAYRPDETDALRDAMEKWIKTDPFVLQQPHRCAHKGLTAMHLHLARYSGEQKIEERPIEQAGFQIIMVEHDWARLFGGAKIEGAGGTAGGEWQLPYEDQAFEFAISGAAVLALCHSNVANTNETYATMTVGIRHAGAVGLRFNQWGYVSGQKLIERGNAEVNAGFDRLNEFLFEQIRAVCIMLDAEVAEIEAVRAPYKTNQPPKARKPLPALSHHIVRLNRKPRPIALAPADRQPGSPKRLHFRRGHWRHYANHKTWIRWCLVGNPDLGFVDHDYRA